MRNPPKAFRYDRSRPTQMDRLFEVWSQLTFSSTEPDILDYFYSAWTDGQVSLLLPHKQSMDIISSWEVV